MESLSNRKREKAASSGVIVNKQKAARREREAPTNENIVNTKRWLLQVESLLYSRQRGQVQITKSLLIKINCCYKRLRD